MREEIQLSMRTPRPPSLSLTDTPIAYLRDFFNRRLAKKTSLKESTRQINASLGNILEKKVSSANIGTITNTRIINSQVFTNFKVKTSRRYNYSRRMLPKLKYPKTESRVAPLYDSERYLSEYKIGVESKLEEISTNLESSSMRDDLNFKRQRERVEMNKEEEVEDIRREESIEEIPKCLSIRRSEDEATVFHKSFLEKVKEKKEKSECSMNIISLTPIRSPTPQTPINQGIHNNSIHITQRDIRICSGGEKMRSNSNSNANTNTNTNTNTNREKCSGMEYKDNIENVLRREKREKESKKMRISLSMYKGAAKFLFKDKEEELCKLLSYSEQNLEEMHPQQKCKEGVQRILLQRKTFKGEQEVCCKGRSLIPITKSSSRVTPEPPHPILSTFILNNYKGVDKKEEGGPGEEIPKVRLDIRLPHILHDEMPFQDEMPEDNLSLNTIPTSQNNTEKYKEKMKVKYKRVSQSLVLHKQEIQGRFPLPSKSNIRHYNHKLVHTGGNASSSSSSTTRAINTFMFSSLNSDYMDSPTNYIKGRKDNKKIFTPTTEYLRDKIVVPRKYKNRVNNSLEGNVLLSNKNNVQIGNKTKTGRILNYELDVGANNNNNNNNNNKMQRGKKWEYNKERIKKRKRNKSSNSEESRLNKDLEEEIPNYGVRGLLPSNSRGNEYMMVSEPRRTPKNKCQSKSIYTSGLLQELLPIENQGQQIGYKKLSNSRLDNLNIKNNLLHSQSLISQSNIPTDNVSNSSRTSILNKYKIISSRSVIPKDKQDDSTKKFVDMGANTTFT